MTAHYQVLISVLIVIAIASGFLILRKALFTLARRMSRTSDIRFEDLLEKGLHVPSTLLILALAVYISLRLSDIPHAYVPYVESGMYLMLILTITMGLANVSGRALSSFMKRVDLPISATGLLLGVTRAIIYVIGALSALNYLGFSITPIITALGVGGLAMALALQDTLSNLFAGIHILAEHTVRVGDFIRLENGQEGIVADIGWRTTRIRMTLNTMVIVPNSKLAQSVVTNYYLPEKRMAINMPVSVSYDADPELVERVLIDVAKQAVGAVPGLLAEPAATARLVPGFGASSLDFTLQCHIGDAIDQPIVQHELHKRIFKRFKQEGIEIPFPTRTIYLHEPASKKN
jgi:small-conductance mechanosensitive channel